MKKIPYGAMMIVLLLSAGSPSLWAYDFGLVLDQDAGLSGSKNDDAQIDNYSAVLVPRLSTLLGDSGDLYVSAGAMVNYENEEWNVIPKLLRTELVWRFTFGQNAAGQSANAKIRAGRIPYADPLDFVAEGLFDGAQVLVDTAAGTFSVGAWYTGLLYKKDARVTITMEDSSAYYAALDYDDFSNTYFASRRVMAALGWEHPALAEWVRLKCALSGQFDVNDTDDPYHSQYASVKAVLPVKRFVFELGGCVQLAQGALVQGDDKFGVGLAGELGGAWMPPTPFTSRLAFNGKISSGKNDFVDAFVPITTKEQGSILSAKLSGLSALALDYTARLHKTFSASFISTYFVRSDLGTYVNYPLYGFGNTKGYFLGNEFMGRGIWSPVSDININVGIGVFVPSMGDAAPRADPRFHLELGMVFALY